MRVLCAAAVIALLAGAAHAQSEHTPQYGEAPHEKTPQEIENDHRAERAYKNSLGNIPDKGPSDPWGNVRSDSPPKDATKAAPPRRTRTGSTAN